MTPEQRIAQLEVQVANLTEQMKRLGDSTSIPFSVEKAFRNRLGVLHPVWEIVYDYSGIAANNTQAVNEGGMASYNVLAAPDGYLFITLPGEDQDIVKLGVPFFNQ